MWQLVRRTLWRVMTRQKLWHGNREPFSNLWSLDPERSSLAEAWAKHEMYRERYLDAIGNAESSHLRFVRLTSRAQVRAWLASVPAG